MVVRQILISISFNEVWGKTMNPLGGQKRIVSPNFLNIVLILIGVFDVLRQRLHDNDRIVKAKNGKVFCLQKILKQKLEND